MRFLVRRGIFYLITTWAVLTLNFLIPRLMPGDPVAILMYRMEGQVSVEAAEAMSIAFGVNTHLSLLEQYVLYWGNIFKGDLGVSITYFPTPVSEVIAGSLPWTIILAGICTIIGFIIGTGLGIVVGWRRGSWMDSLVSASTFLNSIPYFWLALILLSVFGVTLGWFPISGGYSSSASIGFTWEFVGSAIRHGILPAITIIISSLAGWMLSMRNMMVTTLAEDYVLAAEAKGLSSRRVMLRYAARNAVLPNIASFAMSLGFIVSGSLLTEMVFSYPGIGYILFQSVSNMDFPLMQGVLLIIALSVLVANLIADVCYAVLDPRIREAG